MPNATTIPDNMSSSAESDNAHLRVLIADSFQKEGLTSIEALGCSACFEPSCTAEELPALLAKVQPDVLVVRSTKVNADALRASPRLSMVLRAGAGYDTIDISTASAQGISVANCPGMNAIAVAELTWGLILAADRRIPDQTIDLRSGHWKKKEYGKARGLHGRTIGVLGLGRIGLAVIERAHAFGMKVVVWSRSLTDDTAAALGVHRCSSPNELAGMADVVSVHLASTPETNGLIDATFLNAMQHGAILVNTSRGKLVDETALAIAIDTKDLRVGLDVYANEPGAGESQFNGAIAKAPGLYGTHHVAASTDQAQDAIAREAVRIIECYQRTGDVMHCVNRASRTSAAMQLAVRHLNRPGVLSHVFELIGQSGINVEEMENVIFDGGQAASARIQLSEPISADAIDAILTSDAVLSVTQTPLATD
jgi:D-3-phosphoglycerate dehydrogenase